MVSIKSLRFRTTKELDPVEEDRRRVQNKRPLCCNTESHYSHCSAFFFVVQEKKYLFIGIQLVFG
jgi:hypothetical protein